MSVHSGVQGHIKVCSKPAATTHCAAGVKASKCLVWATSVLQRRDEVLNTGRALCSPHHRCDEPGRAEAIPIRINIHSVGAKPGRDCDYRGVAAVEQLLHLEKWLSYRCIHVVPKR